ncbi:hypothetical protein DFH09DRAFT_1074992 [Mycena vulgaris]|nr:hypothetical protein DFH09DRAFT_1074992 [Mycena vulgaris]
MSRRARLFSEFLEESESGSRLSVVPSSVAQGPSLSILLPDCSYKCLIDAFAKRRKTSGLNSRFDRMVQTMNAALRSPVKSARKRAGSTSSASGSSVPKTPLDDYDDFHREAKLGPDFSVIKMGTSSLSRNKGTKKLAGVFPWDQDSSSDSSEPPPPAVPLPEWLASTFSTLTTKHPLRLLLPRRTDSEPTPSPQKSVEVAEGIDGVEDDSPFSFCAPSDPIRVSAPHTAIEAEDDAEPSTQSTQTPSCSLFPEAAFAYGSSALPAGSFGSIPPFSTPGPSSVVSRSDSVPLVQFPEPRHVEYAPALVYIPTVHSQEEEPSHIHSAASFAPPLHSTPTVPYLTYPPEDTALFYYDPNEYANNCSTSDPSPMHSAYNDIFATPARQPIYFDSPTEDPSDSDPLEPSYELESLDFKWEPFIQKPANEENHTKPLVAAAISNSDDYYYEIQVDPEGEDDEDGQLYASINLEPMSPGPFSFAPPHDFSTAREPSQGSEKLPTTPDHPVPQFFAPAPGIFVSPLRDNEVPSSPTVAHSARVGQSGSIDFDHPTLVPQAGDNSQGSQTSNDPIEDWDDEAAD